MAKDKRRLTVDARGAFCPGPLNELIAASQQLHSDTIIDLLTNEDRATEEVKQWATRMGHEFIDSKIVKNMYRLTIHIKRSQTSSTA